MTDDWTYISYDHEGQTVKKVFEAFPGVNVEMKRNTVTVSDGLVGDDCVTVTGIRSASGVTITKWNTSPGAVTICTRTGPQDGLYVVVYTPQKIQAMAGLYVWERGPRLPDGTRMSVNVGVSDRAARYLRRFVLDVTSNWHVPSDLLAIRDVVKEVGLNGFLKEPVNDDF